MRSLVFMVLVVLKMVGAACGHTPSAQRCLFFLSKGYSRGRLVTLPGCVDAIPQSRNATFAIGVSRFGVHPDAVPLVQRDRCVVAMTHGAARKHLRIAEAPASPSVAPSGRAATSACIPAR